MKFKHYLKHALYISLFYSGLLHLLIFALKKIKKNHPVIILFYHRFHQGTNGNALLPSCEIGEFEKQKPSALYGSILLDVRQHGFLTTEMVYRWIVEGKEPAKDTRTAGMLIHRGNFKEILKEQGIRD